MRPKAQQRNDKTETLRHCVAKADEDKISFRGDTSHMHLCACVCV